jgi:hypothetical protein
MAIGQTIFNKLQNVPKGTTLKIIYDGGSTPGRTRYAKYDSMCICLSSIDPHEEYVNIIENHEYKTLFVRKIFTLDVIDNNKPKTVTFTKKHPLENKFNLSLKKNMRITLQYNKDPSTPHTDEHYRVMTFSNFISGNDKYIRCIENNVPKLLFVDKIYNLSVITHPTLDQTDTIIRKQELLIQEMKNSIESSRIDNNNLETELDDLELKYFDLQKNYQEALDKIETMSINSNSNTIENNITMLRGWEVVNPQ